MTQPAVTFQIRQLEERFNTRLFDRAHGHITLTPAGADDARLCGAHSRDVGGARHATEGADRAGRRPAPDRREHDDRGLPAAAGAGRIQGALPGRDAAALRREFRGGAGPHRGAHARSRLHRRRLASADLVTDVCCDDELQVACVPSHPLAKQKSATPAVADGARVHQPRTGVGNARGHRPLSAEERRRTRRHAGRDGSRQSRGDQGTGGDRPGLRDHVARDRSSWRPASDVSCRSRCRRRSTASSRSSIRRSGSTRRS